MASTPDSGPTFTPTDGLRTARSPHVQNLPGARDKEVRRDLIERAQASDSGGPQSLQGHGL
eukprot:180202-Lingulodinium_polyedra.AAC.1